MMQIRTKNKRRNEDRLRMARVVNEQKLENFKKMSKGKNGR